MTFYGESLGRYGATTGDNGDAMRFLYADSDTHTVSAGESFVLGIDPDPYTLVSGDDAVVSWVVETTAGSSGTLTFGSGLDPSFSNSAAAASESLGSQSVTGAQTIVLEQTTITAADIVAGNDEPVLSVECVSGSVSIAQIRMRVWPVGGPAGGWAPGASFTTTGTSTAYDAIGAVEVANYANPVEAWGAGRAAFDSSKTVSFWGLDAGDQQVTSAAGVTRNLSAPDPGLQYGSVFSREVVYLSYQPQVIDYTNSGTPGVHPDRVPGDVGWTVQAVGGGPLLTQFVSWSGGVRVQPGGPSSAQITLTPGEIELTPVGGGEYAGTVPFGTSGVSASTGDLVGLPNAPHVVVGILTEAWSTALTEVGNESKGAVLEGAVPNVLVPDHEWWDPSLPWVPERTPRFFVKDYEGDWRPVGFGKPASDLSLFHVWTPVGWYVECRDGETYNSAHPLKVKLYDGSWDTVAHMRPV